MISQYFERVKTGKNKENLSCLAAIDPWLIFNNRMRMAEHTDEAKDAFENGQGPLASCRDCYLFSIGYVKIYLLANDVICLLSTLTLHIAKQTKLPHSNR